MHANAALLHRFYDAFAARDAEAMAACYAPDAHFSDPAFPDLRGDAIGDMWRMLVTQASSLEVTHTNVVADDHKGTAHWEARYPFGPSKRPVHNVIDAAFEFRDGLIVDHVDTFDFRRWAGQALGPVGVLFGWAPPLRRTVQGQAGKQLAKFRARRAG